MLTQRCTRHQRQHSHTQHILHYLALCPLVCRTLYIPPDDRSGWEQLQAQVLYLLAQTMAARPEGPHNVQVRTQQENTCKGGPGPRRTRWPLAGERFQAYGTPMC
jgi:hypothetical protein